MSDVEKERAAIVAWLRDMAESAAGHVPRDEEYEYIAECIQRGDHLENTNG